MRSPHRQHETAVRYLLGELTENECDKLEEAYFTREGGFEELLAIEQELIDSYVAGELSPAQRRRFERRFPVTDSGDGIEFARVLRAGLRKAPPTPSRGAARWIAALAAVLILAGAWLAFRASSAPRRAPDAPGSAPVAASRDSPSPQPPAPVADEGADGGAPMQERPAPPSVRVTLAAGLLRAGAGMTRVVVPDGAERVVLTLLLESGSRSGLQAVLQTAAGKELYRRGGLDARPTGRGPGVDVPVPAHLLAAGDYVAVLQARDPAGHVSDQDEYAFRVVGRE
jgi:hypothetical protein